MEPITGCLSKKVLLKRLDIDINRWLATMQGWREFIGGVVGGPIARAAAARAKALASTGRRWFQNRCTLFAEHPQSSPVSKAVA